jgi:hypothetical protein
VFPVAAALNATLTPNERLWQTNWRKYKINKSNKLAKAPEQVAEGRETDFHYFPKHFSGHALRARTAGLGQ